MQDSYSEQTGGTSGPAFDVAKAAQLRTQVLGVFRNQLKKIERMLGASLLIMLVWLVFAAHSFFSSTDVQSWILYAVIFLVFFLNTVLMKLWHWIINNKIGVLREVRLLRLDLALQKGTVDTLDSLTAAESPTKWQGVSRAERWAWNVAIIVASISVPVGAMWPWLRMAVVGSHMTSHRAVTLSADGTAHMDTVYSLPNTLPYPIHERVIYGGGRLEESQFIPPAESSWSDGWGRKLAVCREPAGANIREVITLVAPVPAGAEFKLRHTGTHKATLSGDVWTFYMNQVWGYDHEDYTDTVTLPPGATVVSTKPEPVAREVKDGRLVIRFEACLLYTSPSPRDS